MKRMKSYHPNQKPIPAPWMRCVMKNKGGLPRHDFVFLCYRKNQDEKANIAKMIDDISTSKTCRNRIIKKASKMH